MNAAVKLCYLLPTEKYALEHTLARLSYQASIEAIEKLSILQNRLPVRQVAKLAFYFSLLVGFLFFLIMNKNIFNIK